MQTPVMASGNIEDWLLALETEMQKSVRRECKISSLDSGALLSNGLSMLDFVNKSIAQVAILGLQLVWTVDFQDALARMRTDRSVMSGANKKFVQMLSDLVGLCLTDLGSKMNRTKFETL
eukprot:6274895-Amphidinium_carterae.1